MGIFYGRIVIFHNQLDMSEVVTQSVVSDLLDNLLLKDENKKLEAFVAKIDGKMMWTVAGFRATLVNDKVQFSKLSKVLQTLLRIPHGFFAISDNISNENLYSYLLSRYPQPWIRYIISIFGLNEMRHAEAYMEVFCLLFESRQEMFTFLKKHMEIPSVRAMMEWMRIKTKYVEPWTQDTMDLLLTQLFSEGVFFQFPFTIIFWFKSQNLLKGITAINDAINWDEDKHVVFTTYLIEFECSIQKISIDSIKSKVYMYALQAYHLALNYIDEVFIDDFPGFTKQGNITQLQFVINQRLVALKLDPMFPDVKESVFPWADMTALEGKTNFFEFDVPEYARNTAEDQPDSHAHGEYLRMVQLTKDLY